METLKVGDRVEVTREFYFYDVLHEEGLIFEIQEQHIGHNFEKFVVKL